MSQNIKIRFFQIYIYNVKIGKKKEMRNTPDVAEEVITLEACDMWWNGH